MKIDIKLELDNVLKVAHEKVDRAQLVLDNEALKDSNFYAPQDQSELINSSIRNSKAGSGQLVWKTPYAKRLYYNPQYDFSTDMNPNASGLWFEMAKLNNLSRWIDLIHKALNGK